MMILKKFSRARFVSVLVALMRDFLFESSERETERRGRGLKRDESVFENYLLHNEKWVRRARIHPSIHAIRITNIDSENVEY
jgi:hypothetical protein